MRIHEKEFISNKLKDALCEKNKVITQSKRMDTIILLSLWFDKLGRQDLHDVDSSDGRSSLSNVSNEEVEDGTKTLSESERTKLINHTCEKIDELLTKATNNSDLDIFLNSICLNFGIQLKQIKKWKKEAREIQKFLGTPYVLSHKLSKNMENFFNEVNTGMDMKKFATRSEIVILNEAENEKFILSIMDNISRDNVKITFQHGVEFEETTKDGRNVKSVITLSGNKMFHIQKGVKEVRIIREFKEDEMKATMIVGDVEALEVYKVKNIDI